MTPDDQLKTRILQWLATGKTGLSSKTIAFAALDIHYPDARPPMDPSDLYRCMLLVEDIPELLAHIPRVPDTCPRWRPIADHWDELTALLREEEATRRDDRAPRTFQRMKELLEA